MVIHETYQTGDLKNNLAKLRRLSERIKFPGRLDFELIARGDPKQLLSLLHYVLLDFSPVIAREIADQGFELYGTTDRRFIEGVFRLVMEHFNVRPPLTFTQFLTNHYSEPKIILVCETISRVCQRHKEIQATKIRACSTWKAPTRAKSPQASTVASWVHANLGHSASYPPLPEKNKATMTHAFTTCSSSSNSSRVLEDAEETVPRAPPVPMRTTSPDRKDVSNQQTGADQRETVTTESTTPFSSECKAQEEFEDEAAIATALTQMAQAIQEVNKKLDSNVKDVIARFDLLDLRVKLIEDQLLEGRGAPVQNKAAAAAVEHRSDVAAHTVSNMIHKNNNNNNNSSSRSSSSNSTTRSTHHWPPRYSSY